MTNGQDEVEGTPEESIDVRPAVHLAGRMLEDGWRVTRRYEPPPGSTGGAFSVGYLAERDDPNLESGLEFGFVKALDYSSWPRVHPNQLEAISIMTEAFRFERDVVAECRGRHMSNVVRGKGHGELEIGAGILPKVDYLVLELADGDVRSRLDASAQLDAAWALRVLHNIANGLWQLHRASISHQDLKPSNVLMFSDVTKLGDLGRSFWQGRTSPHADLATPGDPSYAPPECQYSYIVSDQGIRSRAADAYHLGSMIVYMFAKVSMTSSWTIHLDPDLMPLTWGGTYDDVLPHLREALNDAIEDVVARFPSPVREDLISMVRELCDPDPTLRGSAHAARRTGNRCSMEQYVSRLDLLSSRVNIHLKRSLQ
jgi:serine/threonine protein kinase